MRKPNVILILTDDQGYPDLGCTGNPWIKTPNIDQFSTESFVFDDFHVAPLCAPTRGGIMTGRRTLRNGVWATCFGRSILRIGEYTLGNLFEDNGYKTGMFGKWHLGDNYPCRPEDMGFGRVVAHKGGGVGQTPDFWGNNYFDDTYYADSTPTQYDGYCTDVWFEQAKNFISENKDQPFFAYIATNAPHGPYLVEDRYTEMYSDNKDIVNPNFYGMITNIDENFGDLRKFLQENGIEDDTVLIFMTDNGSTGSCHQDKDGFALDGYNAGLRGTKASYYDGGHKVPFIIRYPNGNIYSGHTDELCMNIDIFPTLAQICDLEYPDNIKIDGKSFTKVFDGEKLPERTEFIQFHQASELPDKWTNAIVRDKYRLVYGKELYDVSTDPEQRVDISKDHPDVVESMRAEYEKWWAEIVEDAVELTPIVLGNPVENPTKINAMDMFEEIQPVWGQNHVAIAMKCCGLWKVRFDHDGDYSFSLKRWPEEAHKAINELIPKEEFDALTHVKPPKEPVPYPSEFKTAILKIDDMVYEKALENPKSFDVCFDIDNVKGGDATLEAFLVTGTGEQYGAYYVDVLAK